MWQCLGMQYLSSPSRDRTPTPSSLHWELGVLTTELPGKSHRIFFFFFAQLPHKYILTKKLMLWLVLVSLSPSRRLLFSCLVVSDSLGPCGL